ncbi:MAG TPA: GH3 auxin-responsive promoter family protein [Prolixibacteraceae bacterium]|nr:GH3 auxin-responsive promoter family protein [Prolixibacteraceae bacterium]
MIRLFNRNIQKLFTLRYKKFDYFSKYPEEQQSQVLKELIRSARRTEYGKRYHFKNLLTPGDFASHVPLNDYETLKGMIERMIAGERNVLWKGRVKWFAKSSGTTNDKSKFIPVSYDALQKCHYKAALDVFALFLKNNPDNEFLKGKNLTIGGSHKISSLNKKTRTGDLSAVLLQNLPLISRFKNTPANEIALIPDFEEKIEKIVQTTIHENITSFTGVPSWFLVLIKRVLEVTGKDNLLEVWPNLEVFAHGGINFEPYREQYKKLIPRETMHYINTYNASEGFFGIQDNPATDDMLLMLDYGIYYEFIPMDCFFDADRKAIPLHEVQTGVNYAMVITTNGGLWRYIIGDTVEFTSRYPFKIKITGRTKHFINAFGEELIIDNAERGLQKACEKTGAIVQEYTAGPIFMDGNHKGAHQWIIEFARCPSNLDLFIDTLDRELQALNSDYEAKRYKDLTLTRLQLTLAPPGTFYQWMKSRGKMGGQNKIPRLANNREFVEPLLAQINEQENRGENCS